MRIASLRVANLRAIEYLELAGLDDFVMIAGANGCGKTTVLDAVRLLKSVYVQDEYKRWFSEFSVNADRPTNFASLFRDSTIPASIRASIQLSSSELQFIQDRAKSIFLTLLLNERRDYSEAITGEPPLLPPSIDPQQLAEIETRSAKMAQNLREEAASSDGFINIEVTLRSDPPAIIPSTSFLATAFFSCFRPEVLGEFEFHTSRRIYHRETVGSVNLKMADRSEQRRSRFLYDLENKYKNIKTQLLEEYVSAKLKNFDPENQPLQTSLKELFRAFFPGKQFLGISIGEDGSISFPVQLETGEVHDIDELSSGEKEIVYGYLWLRTGPPVGSVILVDEPELHLNPALVQGLPDFYDRHLAKALDAQVWIVTHSDAILRQGVRTADMAVFHMARPDGSQENQAVRIDSQDAVEAAVLDLIGDLAAYRPHARIVLVEGSGPTSFDVDMIRRLFPEYAERANFIAAGSRSQTARIASRLQEVVEAAGLAGRVVAITDRDLSPQSNDGRTTTWPVYEIENFLLVPSVLRATLAALTRDDPFPSDGAVVEHLKSVAEELLSRIALIQTQEALNAELRESLNVSGSPESAVEDLVASTAASQKRISEIDGSEARVKSLLDERRNRLREAIQSDEFLTEFPGERLLSGFAGSFELDKDVFRNACLDQAQQMDLRPEGLETTLKAVLADSPTPDSALDN